VKRFELSSLSDDVLLSGLESLVERDRNTTADLVAHLAEVDARRLFRRSGCDSMHAYCETRLGLSFDSAGRRIQAARTARRFPQILPALADGRLHLTAVCLLAPYLEHCDAAELLAAAEHRTKAQVLDLLAERFPRPDVPSALVAIVPPAPLAPAAFAPDAVPAGDAPTAATTDQYAPAHIGPTLSPQAAPSGVPVVPVVPVVPRASLTPLSPGSRLLRATLDRETSELLLRAQALLGPVIPGGDFAQVLGRVLRDWVQATERRKYGLTERPRKRRSSGDGRYIPAEIKRQVFERDQGRCTFVGENGEPCESRRGLEFDHVKPVAKGGRTCVANLRLRCHAHNQYEAERLFGAGFMKQRRATGVEPTASERLGPRRESAHPEPGLHSGAEGTASGSPPA
jgi:5-methylcytosine-specific restriction endonuclease McrA